MAFCILFNLHTKYNTFCFLKTQFADVADCILVLCVPLTWMCYVLIVVMFHSETDFEEYRDWANKI